MAIAPLTLASAAPRRKHLLERMGFHVRVVPAHLDERLDPGEQPEDFTKRMARSKVLAAVRRLQATQYTADADAVRTTGPVAEPSARWVVGADTVVVVDDLILGKPEDVQEAREMLLRLAGRQHRVITGFCVFDMARNKEGLQAVTTSVTFKPMTRGEIDRYVQAGESMDKAGAYAIQGVGAYLAERLQGSYTNVVGLPLCQVVEMMQEMGASDVLPF